MIHTVVRYTVKPGLEEENAALVRAVYRELEETRPPAFEYATYRLADGTFVHVATYENDESLPLRKLAAFREFREGLDERCEAEPLVTRAEKIGGYSTPR